MPAHTNTHRTRTLLPLILTITLLLTAAAIITTNTRNANAAEPLGTPYPVGDAFGASAFAGNQILASTAGRNLGVYEFDGQTWQKVQELDLAAELQMAHLPRLTLDSLSIDGNMATIALYNGEQSRQALLSRHADGTWALTSSSELLMGSLSNGRIGSGDGQMVHVTTPSPDGWQDIALTPGRFRDIEGDWIALAGPTNDELWHLQNGVWTPAQTLGPSGVGMLIDGTNWSGQQVTASSRPGP